jgi:hypothetical protein
VKEPIGGQALAHGVGEARQFDAVDAHHTGAAKLHIPNKAKDRRALVQCGEGVHGRQRRRSLIDGDGDPGRRDFSGDNALARVGLDTIDTARLARQPLPDRQQEAGDDVKRRLQEFREIGDFLLPGSRESPSIRLTPMRLLHRRGGKRRTLHRAHQTHPPFDVAIVGHHAPRGDLNGGAPGLAVDEEKRARIAQEFERLVEGERLRSIALSDRQQFRTGRRDGMNEDRPAVRDDEAVGLQRLEPEIVSP